MKIEGSELISIDVNSFVIDAIYFMRTNNIRRIGVTKDNNLIGLFTVDEALYYILENELELKLENAKLKKPIMGTSNEMFDVVKTMTANNTDFVLYDGKIITYKDVVKSFDWEKVAFPIKKISKPAIVVEPYTKISTTISLMLKNRIRHVPVYEKYLYGIVSARDIVYNFEKDLELSVSRIMTVEVYHVGKEEPISSVVEHMIQRNIGSVVVYEPNHQVEIATLKDFVGLILRNLIS